MAITLVLVDKCPIVLDGLMQLFQAEPDMRVVARCTTRKEAIEVVGKHRPDVLILDICIPFADGLAILREMKKVKLPTRVVLFTTSIDEDQVLEVIRLGVRGMVLKEMAPQYLVRCVRKVHDGEQWLEKHSFGRALDKLLQREAAAREIAGILTLREIEIVRMVVGGRRNREIADGLSVSEGTVKTHLHNVYKKLRVDSRVALTLYAQRKGLV